MIQEVVQDLVQLLVRAILIRLLTLNQLKEKLSLRMQLVYQAYRQEEESQSSNYNPQI